jgi:hypothetical protein
MGMDFGAIWAAAVGSLPKTWDEALGFFYIVMENPWTRTMALVVIVYFTIRVIASIYSGDKQGAELGPVAIRQHTSAKFGRDTIRMPHYLMPMTMDGVSAKCKIFYVYTDHRGRRRKHLVHTIDQATLSISPVALTQVQNMIFGQEIPAGVATQHVCFPPVDVQESAGPFPPTPALASEYVSLHKILENWTEDDSAARVSMSSDVKDEIATGKTDFIANYAQRLQKADRGWRWGFKRLHENRPNVIGSYYLKFEFSHEPLFVLTRHPDRDLKMTAWLTILTSMFALIMDWWPQGSAPFGLAPPGVVVSAPDNATTARTPRVVPR